MKIFMLIFLVLGHTIFSMEMSKNEDKAEKNKPGTRERSESQARENEFKTMKSPLEGQIPDVTKSDKIVIGSETTIINFEGEEATLAGHILKSFQNKNYSFSETVVFKYREEKKDNEKRKKIFTRIGDILKLSQDDIKQEIKAGNWLYDPHGLVQKTRLSNEPKEIGMLILGTTNKKRIKQLNKCLVNQLLKKTEPKP